jgi:Zinc knuckle
MKSNNESENEEHQAVATFGGQFKSKCRNCGMIGHKSRDCKNKFR